ncbi:PGAM [Seminavis robusta]|uniref:PGAM n=1 Tax=Seminavis robusta TaxID=568900 RepID=A0A9N8E4T2_9STRA|nr:PGAM [Seminavis robusta]|eukprot:Sro668_g184390.1 PGAM (313) ;mRNA; r:38788-39726
MSNEVKDEADNKKFYLVVARHGERWDYVQRNAGHGADWIATAKRPWDPPLSPLGLKQASRLGSHLMEKLAELKLPPIAACYSSPFLRCRQTSCQAVEAMMNGGTATTAETSAPLKVQIEIGLSESLNKSWYRSWALPGADSTWGFVPPEEKQPGKRRRGLNEYSPEELHLSSRVPAPELLTWKEATHESSPNLQTLQDMEYQSTTAICKPFALRPKVLVETAEEQQTRMFQVVANKARPGQTILVVSHGGPVTHLYEKLSGKHWNVHGESKYCCYSIYECDSPEKMSEVWKTVVVNESKYLDDLWSDGTANI